MYMYTWQNDKCKSLICKNQKTNMTIPIVSILSYINKYDIILYLASIMH